MSNKESPITIHEHLSALLDDEAGSFESRRVLDEMKSDQSLTQKLSTYAFIGETMRTGDTEKPVFSLGSGFLESIHEKISLEDNFNQVIVDSKSLTNHVARDSGTVNSSTWLRPVGGFAVAASIGALAFMGLQNISMLSGQQSQPDNIANNSASSAIVQTVPVSKPIVDPVIATNNDQYIDANAQTRSMLKRYVDSHMQYATTATFVPSVRVIAYTDQQ